MGSSKLGSTEWGQEEYYDLGTKAYQASSNKPLPPFRPFSPGSVPPPDSDTSMSKQQLKERKKKMKAYTQAQIKKAKRNANISMPPPNVSIFASTSTMGCYLGVGIGLYFQMLEWLMILFACITFLSVPFWIVINQSVFTDKANKDNYSVGVKVFDKASMLSTTFASIVGHTLDPNNTLVYMNTLLGGKWYGPQEKDDFLLWISLLDVVGVCISIFLVTYYTWKAGWLEKEVDENSYDATDYAVLVTGLPPDAGFHEIGHFFSRFGEVMDVTLVMDMELVLAACARASKLENKRALQVHYMRMLPMECRDAVKKHIAEIEDELIQVLKDINEHMDKQIAQNKKDQAKGQIQKGSFLRPNKHTKVHAEVNMDEESQMIKSGGPMGEAYEAPSGLSQPWVATTHTALPSLARCPPVANGFSPQGSAPQPMAPNNAALPPYRTAPQSLSRYSAVPNSFPAQQTAPIQTAPQTTPMYPATPKSFPPQGTTISPVVASPPAQSQPAATAAMPHGPSNQAKVPDSKQAPDFAKDFTLKGFYKNTFPTGVFKRETVYATKAAFVTFNRMSEQKECLKLTPNPGFRGWLYRNTVAKSTQCIRGYCIETRRACGPSDYIFENMCISKRRRLMRRILIRFLYLVLLIACALIVSALSSRTRVNLNRTELDFDVQAMNVDVARAASYLPTDASTNTTISSLRNLYEAAMQAVFPAFTATGSFSSSTASKANFTDYCTLALPNVCTDYFQESLGGPARTVGLEMAFREQIQWASYFEEAVYQRPLLEELANLAAATNPQKVEGTDIGLSACLACYCLGLQVEDNSKQQTGAWLAVSQEQCNTYQVTSSVQSSTSTAISVVIVILNVLLKTLVQFLAAHEYQWTQSQLEKSFCVVAYISQFLNSVLVVILVNARPNAQTTKTGQRINAENIQWLSYIILGGSFDDFTPTWYQYVGESFMTLLFIQLIIPFVNIIMEFSAKGINRLMVRCNTHSTQGDFNAAYSYPQFLLQQRVADQMLNVSVALLFCTGMPLCAAVLTVVFAITTLVDRWAAVSLMSVTRYGSQLPRLMLDLLPIAVFLNCCFGLWMNTYFMIYNFDSNSTSLFVQMGAVEASKINQNQFGFYLDAHNLMSRISQPNGFGLLLLAFLIFLWMVYRYIIAEWLNPIIFLWLSGKEQEALEENGEATNSRTYRFFRRLMAIPKLKLPGMPDCPEDDDDLTFEDALLTERLQGIPTFRLPFLPRYAYVFSGLLHGAIWLKMLGPCRYTRLVPTREEELLCVYRVTVNTSDIPGAGTDSEVLITFHGERDGKAVASHPHDLDTIGNNFERGNSDNFEVTARDVGRITHIVVRSCGRGLGAAWHLNSVLVTDTLRGIMYNFPCSQWLDPHRPKSLVQKLYPAATTNKANPQKALMSKQASITNQAETIIEFMDATGTTREMEEKQRQNKLTRVRLGWKVSPQLILDAGEAPLDDNCAELKERGLGSKLAAYVASMAVLPEVPKANTPSYARQQLQEQQESVKQLQYQRTLAKQGVPDQRRPQQAPAPLPLVQHQQIQQQQIQQPHLQSQLLPQQPHQQAPPQYSQQQPHM